MKIGIVGGTGRMGLLFARYFKSKGNDVFISGRDLGKAKKIARLNGLAALAGKELMGRCDVILFSVPMSAATGVIRELAPLARPGSLICDLTSIKKESAREMLKRSGLGVDVAGLHPLFGPSVPIEGQNLAVIPVRGRRFLPWMRKVFGKSNLVFTTVKEHDEMMAIVQCLVHFTSIATAMAMKSNGTNLARADRFSTPIYRERIRAMKRILSQDPELYADIEMKNRNSKKAIEAFMLASKKLKDIIRRKDVSGFSRVYKEMARYVKNSRI